MRERLFFVLLFLGLLAAHLCHYRILWTEEGLPLAAARQILFGKMLYRDIWFDKPPIAPLVSLLCGARIGFALRVLGALYAFACCVMASFFARNIRGWGPAEGMWAAGLLGFFLTFDTPSAVIPLAADLLMLLPHLGAVYLAYRKKPFWSGIVAAIAFLTNVKGALVVAACAVFCWPAIPSLAIGFVLPNAIVALVLWVSGSWPSYFDQVWVWPAAYAASSYVSDPLRNGAIRTLNWAGFHVTLVVAAGLALFFTGGLRARERAKWLIWIALSFAGVAMGARFFPRYFFQLLPVLVLLAGRGFVLTQWKTRWILLALLVIPFIRFGPRYPMLALGMEPDWSDIAMDSDSRAAAALIQQQARPGDTLYVWGYRPDIFVYTGMEAASKYLDSQAMTGVPADRHLGQSRPVGLKTTAEARRELAKTKPTFIADGLSLYNPNLSIDHYPELRTWFAGYEEFARTPTTVLYRRKLR